MDVGHIGKARITVEIGRVKNNYKNHGITCNIIDESNFRELRATINGPKDTPYENGHFVLHIKLPDQYPFRPPTVTFVTPIFHPNIDEVGNICLDLLRIPPSGTYNPAISLESILLSIQLLLATPNSKDPLNGTAADLFNNDKAIFEEKARSLTGKHAIRKSV